MHSVNVSGGVGVGGGCVSSGSGGSVVNAVSQNNSISRNERPNIPPPLMSQPVAVPLMSIQTVKPTFGNSSNNMNSDNLSNFQVIGLNLCLKNFRIALLYFISL